jgi:hypothetical protein
MIVDASVPEALLTAVPNRRRYGPVHQLDQIELLNSEIMYVSTYHE